MLSCRYKGTGEGVEDKRKARDPFLLVRGNSGGVDRVSGTPGEERVMASQQDFRVLHSRWQPVGTEIRVTVLRRRVWIRGTL
jgi:hypothetical protein